MARRSRALGVRLLLTSIGVALVGLTTLSAIDGYIDERRTANVFLTELRGHALHLTSVFADADAGRLTDAQLAGRAHEHVERIDQTVAVVDRLGLAIWGDDERTVRTALATLRHGRGRAAASLLPDGVGHPDPGLPSDAALVTSPAELRAAVTTLHASTDRAARAHHQAVEFAMSLSGVGIALLVAATAASVVLLFKAARDANDADRLAQDLIAERQTLRQSEERFRSLVLNTSDVITILTIDATIEYQSPSAERIWGYTARELAKTSLLSLVHVEDLETARNLVAQALSRPRLGLAAELRLRLADESWAYFEVVMTNLLRDPRVAGLVATFRDVSERKNFEQALAYQAFHDALTGLPNRSLFVDRVERALARATPRGGSIAVMFLDLDNFKLINDSLGHSIGDQLLVAVTHRIQGCLRRQDTLARLSGDEFSILIEDVTGVDDALAMAQRLQQAFQAPFSLDGHEMFANASVGVVLSAPHHDRPDDLLRDADVAMYRAKANGKARCEVFDHSMNVRVTERLALETSLRRALERGELRVHYQPIVELVDGEIVGFEALVRWEHPQRGLVSPSEFVPLAEETGLILPIGRLVLEEACRQLKVWQRMVGPARRLSMSVNVSARQLQHPGLVETVAEVLETTGIEPSALKLELTESLMMQDLELTIERLRALQSLSVELALDDFGTGYSSLAYLRRLPISFLKIDRSFVAQLGVDPEDSAIVRTIVRLAHDLGMSVIAEGVETGEQSRELLRLGCKYGQGYVFSRPVPAAIAELLLLDEPTRALAS